MAFLSECLKLFGGLALASVPFLAVYLLADLIKAAFVADDYDETEQIIRTRRNRKILNRPSTLNYVSGKMCYLFPLLLVYFTTVKVGSLAAQISLEITYGWGVAAGFVACLIALVAHSILTDLSDFLWVCYFYPLDDRFRAWVKQKFGKAKQQS